MTPVSPAPLSKKGPLDFLPPAIRHAVILGMGWVISNGANSLTHLHMNQAESTAAGAGLSLALLVFTPLTKQYGLGK